MNELPLDTIDARHLLSQLVTAQPALAPAPRTYEVKVPDRFWPLIQIANAGGPICKSILSLMAHEADLQKRNEMLGELWQLCQMVMKKAVREDRAEHPPSSRRKHHKKRQ